MTCNDANVMYGLEIGILRYVYQSCAIGVCLALLIQTKPGNTFCRNMFAHISAVRGLIKMWTRLGVSRATYYTLPSKAKLCCISTP